MNELRGATVGSRLEKAIARAGITKSELSKRLEEAGVRGATRRSVYNYTLDRTKPSISWLQAAADTLGVSWEWLATGEGPATEAEAQADEELRQVREWVEDANSRHAQRISACAKLLQLRRSRPSGVAASALDLLMLAKEGHDRLPLTREAVLKSVISVPLNVWGLDRDEIPDRAWTAYVSLHLEALNQLMEATLPERASTTDALQELEPSANDTEDEPT